MTERDFESFCCCRHTTAPSDPPCCCDCTEIDQICDRCCRCGGVDIQEVDRCFQVMEDRCRFPSCFGRGAIQVRLDLVVPLLTIPVGIVIGSLSRWLTLAVLVLWASCVWLYYRVWKHRPVRTQTKFFYMWSLVSCLVVYYVFELVVAIYREVLFWENMTLSCMFAAMMYVMYLCRQSPGHVLKNGAGRYPRPTSQSSWDEAPRDTYPQRNHGSGQQEYCQINVYSGGTEVCEDCQTDRPPRAAHCPVCAVCVLRRDHHCIWVDNCIGQKNHRAFLLGLGLFLLCGCYGSHLMLTTVCTPEMYLDWFLLPADCRFVYNDILSAIGYVCAVYTLLVCAAMAVVLFQQVALVSQGVTSQELRMADSQRGVRWGLFVVNNTRSRGFVHNWRSFLLGY